MTAIKEGDRVRDSAKLLYEVLSVKHWHDGVYALCTPYGEGGIQIWIAVNKLTQVAAERQEGDSQIAREPSREHSDAGRADVQAMRRDVQEISAQVKRLLTPLMM